LFGCAECIGMCEMPEIGASQHGDDRRAHLRTKKLLAAGATGSRQRKTGARQNTEERMWSDKVMMSAIGMASLPSDVAIRYT
jgi:hypothetical protein